MPIAISSPRVFSHAVREDDEASLVSRAERL
jgi:hypothetical protein